MIAEHYGAGCSREIQHPYMASEYLSIVFLCPDQSLPDGWTRHVMRPGDGTHRPTVNRLACDKMDFGASSQHGLLVVDRDQLELNLLRGNEINDILNSDEVLELWQKGDGIYDATAVKLSQLATLSRWSQRRRRLMGNTFVSPGATVRKL
jgi:hypothetical protein